MAQTANQREIADALANARKALAETSDPVWFAEQRPSWLLAIDSIERRMSGNLSERGFSIIRSLDAGPGVDGPISEALLSLSAALRAAGIDDYR